MRAKCDACHRTNCEFRGPETWCHEFDAIQYPLESDPRVIELIAQERKRLANLCNAIAKELAGDPACIGAMRCVSKIRGEK